MWDIIVQYIIPIVMFLGSTVGTFFGAIWWLGRKMQRLDLLWEKCYSCNNTVNLANLTTKFEDFREEILRLSVDYVHSRNPRLYESGSPYVLTTQGKSVVEATGISAIVNNRVLPSNPVCLHQLTSLLDEDKMKKLGMSRLDVLALLVAYRNTKVEAGEKEEGDDDDNG